MEKQTVKHQAAESQLITEGKKQETIGRKQKQGKYDESLKDRW